MDPAAVHAVNPRVPSKPCCAVLVLAGSLTPPLLLRTMRPRSAHCGDDSAGHSHSRHGSGIRVLVGAALLLLAVCASAVVPAAHAAHLQFGMRAAWSSTPLAFEAR